MRSPPQSVVTGGGVSSSAGHKASSSGSIRSGSFHQQNSTTDRSAATASTTHSTSSSTARRTTSFEFGTGGTATVTTTTSTSAVSTTGAGGGADARDKHGRTALQYHASSTYDEESGRALVRAKELLEHTIRWDSQNGQKQKPLSSSSSSSQKQDGTTGSGGGGATNPSPRKRSGSFNAQHHDVAATASSLTRKILVQKDWESGYTALHRAVFSRDLRMVLLLLRYASCHENATEEGDGTYRMTTKGVTGYWSLLECGEDGGGGNTTANTPGGGGSGSARPRSNSGSAAATTKTTVEELSSSIDREGMTPLRLLGELYCPDLVCAVERIVAKYRGGNVAPDNDIDSGMCWEEPVDEGDNDQALHGDTFHFPRFVGDFPMGAASGSGPRRTGGASAGGNGKLYSTEVVTFGRSDHAALGQFRASSSSSQLVGVMGRVKTFASPATNPAEGRDEADDEDDIGPAVVIDAAAHHTLVATAKGQLYAFGLGKGGRLGMGDERNYPLPQRIMGPLGRQVVTSVAAAENHSLCSTATGTVYAWGSNRFGQLGVRPSKVALSSSSSSSQSTVTTLSIPARIEDLKRVFVVKVAAGDRHSVALSRQGEVYCWGDNKAGQLGWTPYRASTDNTKRSSTPASLSSPSSVTSAPLTTHVHAVGRVETLWSSSSPQHRRVAIAIAAADKTTLVVTGAPRGEFANSVYSWGHGNYIPVKINFPVEEKSASKLLQSTFSKGDVVNPVAVACAKHHNVAITEDGRVYTWGLHAEPLARDSSSATSSPKPASSSSSISNQNGHYKFSSPQLVRGMLPHRGGGKAVAVSASEHHTAVVTSCGHLYTWGATYGNHTLGHQGVKYQPSPRRVPGVVRAVAVAAARDHTALLIGTTIPSARCLGVPSIGKRGVDSEFPGFVASPVPSLQRLAERTVARHVNLYNVIPILITSERLHTLGLRQFCLDFIRLNMDGVLAMAKKVDLETLLDESLLASTLPRGFLSTEELMESAFCPSSSSNQLKARSDSVNTRRSRSRGCSIGGAISDTAPPREEEGNGAPAPFISDRMRRLDCSDGIVTLLASPASMSNPVQVAKRYEALSKAARALKKKLNLIRELEATAGANGDARLSTDQRQKLARRPQLEVDLAAVKPELDEVERRMLHYNLFNRDPESVLREMEKYQREQEVAARMEKEKQSVARKLFEDGDSNEGGDPPQAEQPQTMEQPKKEYVSFARLCCDLCKVTCPDEVSLVLHITGRKHRNRLDQAEKASERETANQLRGRKGKKKRGKGSNSDARSAVADQKQEEGEEGDRKLPAKPVAAKSKETAAEDSQEEDERKRAAKPVARKSSDPPKPSDVPSIQPKYTLAPPATHEPDSPCSAPSPMWMSPPSPSWGGVVPRKKSFGQAEKRASGPAKDSSSLMDIMANEAQTKKAGDLSARKSVYPVKGEPVTSGSKDLFVPKFGPKSVPSLHDIILQEEKKRTGVVTARKTPSSLEKKAAPISRSLLSLDKTGAKELSSPPLGKRSDMPASSPPALSLSLGSLLEKETPKPKASAAPHGARSCQSTPVAAWTKKPDRAVSKRVALSDKLSFHDIQKEEETMKANESGVIASEAAWFIQRRQRASSLGEIQKQQEEDEREMQRLVDEQKAIEEQIANERREREAQEKRKANKNRRGKKNGGKANKQTGEVGDGGGHDAARGSQSANENRRRQRPRRRRQNKNAGGSGTSDRPSVRVEQPV